MVHCAKLSAPRENPCVLCGKKTNELSPQHPHLSPFNPLCGTSSAVKTKSSSKDDCTSGLKIRSITSRNCKFQEASAPLAKTLASLAEKINGSRKDAKEQSSIVDN
ncbi:hypothetical protein CLV48_1211 [Cecembia rubra]|uniref:Uncharacterized protein n=1 Tax=Cecembia rubra TaxID=1485585 RepID=A0A2P8DK47_9BACT|nr:hypothetical protein CLV48_1211 [Cecembia rubra]